MQAPDAPVASAPASIDVAALTRAMQARLPGGLAGPLSVSLLSGGRSNPTYDVRDGRHAWVLRRPPFGAVHESAHDMAREHRVLQALAPTPVPVPTPVFLCDDETVLGAPFYVMDRVDGVIYRSREQVERLTLDQRRSLGEALVDTMVVLHRVDPDAVGLTGWGRPDGYLHRQVRRWRGQWEAMDGPRVLPRLGELLDRLGRSVPETRYPGIVHGDFKIDNLMVAADDPGHVLALLDWEIPTLGDTLADLGMLLMFWDEGADGGPSITEGVTALPGLPTADEVVRRYAAGRGIPVPDVDWYVVFAHLKLAVILEQIHVRHRQGHTVGEGFTDIGAMIAPMVDRAAERLTSSSSPSLRG